MTAPLALTSDLRFRSGLEGQVDVGAGGKIGADADGTLLAQGDAGVDLSLGAVEAQFGGGGAISVGESEASMSGDVDLGLVSVGGGVSLGGREGPSVSFDIGAIDGSSQQGVEVSAQDVKDTVTEVTDAAGDFVDDTVEAGTQWAEDTADGAGDFIEGFFPPPD